MRTNRITGHSGCELNHTFDTESTGALEPIYLSSNNTGVVFQTKVVGGYEGDPAVQEQLTETYIMPETLVAGDIEVYYNSAEATLVTLDGTEDLAGVYEAIALSAPEGYSATDDASIIILKTVAGANVIPLSIDLGSTGITKDTSVLIPGEDADNDDVPKATSVATEYTLDTISNVRSGSALWNEIETIASGNTKLATLTYPVTAVRLLVKTAARDATAQVILRTSA